MILVRARCISENVSGYYNKVFYDLQMKTVEGKIKIREASRKEHIKEYANIEAFLDNFDLVKKYVGR